MKYIVILKAYTFSHCSILPVFEGQFEGSICSLNLLIRYESPFKLPFELINLISFNLRKFKLTQVSSI